MKNIVQTSSQSVYYVIGICVIAVAILLQVNSGLAIEAPDPYQPATNVSGTLASSPLDFQCQSTTQVSISECTALVDLYKNTSGAIWHNSQGWLSDPDLCAWHGVLCNEDGAIIGIDLHGNLLSGMLPNSIGQFDNLQLLGLWDNQLTGNIPPTIGNLKQLSLVDLSNNRLTGSLPKEIGNLPNLESLWIPNNLLSGPIPDELNALANLTSLNLESNKLTGSYPLELIEKSTLTEVLLGHNALVVHERAFRSSTNSHIFETQTTPPIDLSIAQVNNESVLLTWTPITHEGDAGMYQISYRTASEPAFTDHVTTESKQTQQITLDGLTPNTTYQFAIRTMTKAHALQKQDLWSTYSEPIAIELALMTPQTYAANLAITALEVTQGLQNLANEMPLIADRLTWVRVYAQTDNEDIPAMRARLRAFRNGRELADSPLAMEDQPITVKESGGERLNLEDSFQFSLPAAWRTGTVTFRAELLYDDTVSDTELSNNSWEETITFHPSKPLSIVMVPLKLYDNGDTSETALTYRTTDADFDTIIANAYRYMPVAKITWREHEQVLEPDCDGICDINSQFDPTRILQELEAMRNAEEKVDRFYQSANGEHWIGMVDPELLFGGLAIRPDKEYWRSFSAWTSIVSMYGPTYTSPYEIGGSLAIMHEISHNLGMMHVDCGAGEGNPSLAYPYNATAEAPCTLDAVDERGFYGFDVYYEAAGVDEPLVIGNGALSDRYQTAYPMMSYKFPGWPSPYKYCQLLIKFGVDCTLYQFEDSPTGMSDEPTSVIDLDDAHRMAKQRSQFGEHSSNLPASFRTGASVLSPAIDNDVPPTDQRVLLEDFSSLSIRVTDIDHTSGESDYKLGSLSDPSNGFSTSNGQIVYYISELKKPKDDRIEYTLIDRAGVETSHKIEVIAPDDNTEHLKMLPLIAN